MRVTLDRATDTAYIYFTSVEPSAPLNTYLCDPVEVRGQINLDFNASGLLVGIEVLDASKKLPADLLEIAELIG